MVHFLNKIFRQSLDENRSSVNNCRKKTFSGQYFIQRKTFFSSKLNFFLKFIGFFANPGFCSIGGTEETRIPLSINVETVSQESIHPVAIIGWQHSALFKQFCSNVQANIIADPGSNLNTPLKHYVGILSAVIRGPQGCSLSKVNATRKQQQKSGANYLNAYNVAVV